MDSVPFHFHKAVALNFRWGNYLFKLSKVPTIGDAATEIAEKYAYRHLTLENGELDDERFWYRRENGKWAQVQEGRRYSFVAIEIKAGNHAYEADPHVLQSIRECCIGKGATLYLRTGNLSKGIEALIGQISVTGLHLDNDAYADVQSTLKIMPILKTTVKKRILPSFKVGGSDRNDVTTVNFLVSSLMKLWKQDQFEFADIPVLTFTILMALFVVWNENSAQMTGKYLQFKSLADNVDREQWGLRTATQDELDYLLKYFPRACRYLTEVSTEYVWFIQGSNGGKMFWLTKKDNYALVFL